MSAAQSDCIFCKIASGQVPALKLYEDASVVAFLDIAPLSRGHVLVVPKIHRKTLDEMSSDEISGVARVLPRLARALRELPDVEGYNLLQNNERVAGQAVDHVHFHLIPRQAGDALGYRWNAGEYVAGEDKDLQNQLIGILSRLNQA